MIDPETGREVGYGERGERVCTSFGRSAILLLRYRTSDLVVKVPHTRASSGGHGTLRGRDHRPGRRHEARPRHQRLPGCGRGHRPRVRRHRGVPDRISRLAERDEIELLVETLPTVDDAGWALMADRLTAELADAHEDALPRPPRRHRGTAPVRAEGQAAHRPAPRRLTSRKGRHDDDSTAPAVPHRSPARRASRPAATRSPTTSAPPRGLHRTRRDAEPGRPATLRGRELAAALARSPSP
ncbi:hypothetical protein HBB16_10320 [Pseudonocardia sp. MCCB 268]|nr:hypothetical protein [Pseudonocardia cytotoxica]